MKRRWRVVLLHSKGEFLGTVEAPDMGAGERKLAPESQAGAERAGVAAEAEQGDPFVIIN